MKLRNLLAGGFAAACLQSALPIAAWADAQITPAALGAPDAPPRLGQEGLPLCPAPDAGAAGGACAQAPASDARSAALVPKATVAAPPDAAIDALLAQASHQWFKTQWEAYAQAFISADGRVLDNANGGISHSEGQGYALLLAGYAEDAQRFDAIWRWTKFHLGVRPDGLMAWKWDPQTGQVADRNNATDGDILLAWALAEGARRFGRPEYRVAAAKIAESIGAKAFAWVRGHPILMPAAAGFGPKDQPDGPVINLSYWVFPAFPSLKLLAPRYDWDALHAQGLTLLAASRFGPRRLPAEWQSTASSPTAPAKNFPAEFSYNAIRIPLYLAWDADTTSLAALGGFSVLWNGAHGLDPAIVKIGTSAAPQRLDGAGYRLVAALARCSATGQAIDDDLIKSHDSLYYPESLRMLSLAVIQERFPQCL